MKFKAARNGGGIEFQAWISGDGATADFALFRDDGAPVPANKQPDESWNFIVSSMDLQDKSGWPSVGYPVLKTIEPTWLSGTPTVHLTAAQSGVRLKNYDVTGNDPTLLTTASSNGKTIATAFRLEIQ